MLEHLYVAIHPFNCDLHHHRLSNSNGRDCRLWSVRNGRGGIRSRQDPICCLTQWSRPDPAALNWNCITTINNVNDTDDATTANGHNPHNVHLSIHSTGRSPAPLASGLVAGRRTADHQPDAAGRHIGHAPGGRGRRHRRRPAQRVCHRLLSAQTEREAPQARWGDPFPPRILRLLLLLPHGEKWYRVNPELYFLWKMDCLITAVKDIFTYLHHTYISSPA